jgi:hypothetical protein
MHVAAGEMLSQRPISIDRTNETMTVSFLEQNRILFVTRLGWSFQIIFRSGVQDIPKRFLAVVFSVPCGSTQDIIEPPVHQ